MSFAPVVFPGEVGNGCHLHLSVWRGGRNLLQGGDRGAGTTAAGAAALAGVVAALPELLAVLAPSPVAYLRLQPHHWAGAYACWGIENRDHHVRDRVLREDDSRIRRKPGVFARLRSFALNVLRANGVSNVSEAVYVNALSLDRLLAYGLPRSQN